MIAQNISRNHSYHTNTVAFHWCYGRDERASMELPCTKLRVYLPVVLLGSICITEMTEVVVSTQVFQELVVIQVPFVTEFAKGMSSVGCVVRVSLRSMSNQVFTVVPLFLIRKYLGEHARIRVLHDYLSQIIPNIPHDNKTWQPSQKQKKHILPLNAWHRFYSKIVHAVFSCVVPTLQI